MQKMISYPFNETSKSWHVTGTVLILLSGFVIPFAYLLGYYIRALTHTSIGIKQPPEFTEFKSVTKLGGIGIIVSFIYSGVLIGLPLVITSLTLRFAISIIPALESTLTVNTLAYLLGMILLLTIFIIPVILCQLGRTGDHTSLYNFTEMVLLLINPAVVKAIFFSITLGVFTVLTTMFFIGITFGLGVILLPTISFWFLLVTAHIYGTAIGRATGTLNLSV